MADKLVGSVSQVTLPLRLIAVRYCPAGQLRLTRNCQTLSFSPSNWLLALIWVGPTGSWTCNPAPRRISEITGEQLGTPATDTRVSACPAGQVALMRARTWEKSTATVPLVMMVPPLRPLPAATLVTVPVPTLSTSSAKPAGTSVKPLQGTALAMTARSLQLARRASGTGLMACLGEMPV